MEPAEAPELPRRKMSVARRLCFLRCEAPPPRKLSINNIVLTTQHKFP